MLRTDAELERPDLMLFMVRHWLDVRQNKKLGGSIHIGAYVTLIAEKLGVSLAGLRLSKGPRLMDARAYQSATFIKIERGPANHPDRYFWRLQDGTQHLLPIHAPLSFDDESTCFFSGALPAAHDSPPPVQPHATYVDMPDETRSPPNATCFQGHVTRIPGGASHFHASTYAAPPSYPPPIAEPTIQDVYSLMYDMRGEQSAILYDIQSRVAVIEDELRDWRFDPSDD